MHNTGMTGISQYLYLLYSKAIQAITLAVGYPLV